MQREVEVRGSAKYIHAESLMSSVIGAGAQYI